MSGNGSSSASSAAQHALFVRGVALFDDGKPFEAHEVWEELWREVKRRGPSADEVFLRALIRLAAAVVKQQRGEPRGTLAHATSVLELLPQGDDVAWGLDVQRLRAMAQALLEDPKRNPGPLPSQQLSKSR